MTSTEVKGIQDYIRDDGFVDVPRIVAEGLEHALFPGLLSNVSEIRQKDFPLFDKLGRVYLDNAATTQEPKSVIDRMYRYRTAQIRGSNHSKNSAEARQAQQMFDESRKKLEDFFCAHNYITGFTSGTTDTSNWLATRFPFEKNDLLILTEMEHNSQILTARNFARKAGAEVLYVPVILPEGKLDLDYLKRVVSERKKGKILMNLVHVSNVSGIVNPVKEIRDILNDRGFIYLDIAQSAGHMQINLDILDVDFVGCSAHKMYGPMGIGAIFVNKRNERYIDNRISGGSAVRLVSRKFDVAANSPERFEPGTPNLEGVTEWEYTLDYLKQIGMDKIEIHDKELGKYFVGELQKIKGLKIYGPTDFKDRNAVVTFNIGSRRRKIYDKVAKELDERGICVRDGCFCAHIYTSKLLGLSPLIFEGRTAAMKLGVSEKLIKLPGAVRASFAFYNTLEDAYKAVVATRDIAYGLLK